jgi:FkbM family methyltransferase
VKPAPVHVEVEGLNFYGGEVHRAYLEAISRHEREAYMAELFQRAVSPGDVIVDVGAFLGYFALLGVNGASRARAYAFEPDPRDFPWLSHNIEANGLGDRVQALSTALSNRPGWVTLYLAQEDQTQSSVYPLTNHGRSVQVEAVTLDAFLGDTVPDIVKIDVEGAELQALEGMTRSIQRGRPLLFVEWNPRALIRAGAQPEILLRRLEELGYRIELIDEDRRRVMDPVFPDGKTYVNLRCVPI